MKFTIFEKVLIHLIVGHVHHAPISEIEVLLDLRSRFKPTKKEAELDEKADSQINKKTTEISLSEQEKELILAKMQLPGLGLPVNEHTLHLYQKLQPKNEESK